MKLTLMRTDRWTRWHVVGAIAKGRGERLTPVSLSVLDLVLAKPALRVSAGAAYEALVGFSGSLAASSRLNCSPICAVWTSTARSVLI